MISFSGSSLKFTHPLVIAGIALCLVIIGASGGYYFALVKQSKEIEQLQSDFAECTDENVGLLDEFNRCLQNRAEIVGRDAETYNFSTFGIFSPLFENLPVDITAIDYKRCITTKKEIILDSLVVSVSQHCMNHTSNYELASFNVFYGYEFAMMSPTSVADKITEWEQAERFENEYQLVFHPRYNYYPKSIGSVTLEGFVKWNPTGYPIFIEVSAPVENWTDSETEPQVIAAKEKAWEVAKTISTRPY